MSDVCQNAECGRALPPRRKLKTFCSYACRGQQKALEATDHRTGLSGAKNAKQNKALQTLKRQSLAGYSFAKINSVTYRMDRPSKKGAGWLMEVAGARQRWVARVGNRASEPLPLDAAKRAAVTLLRERGKTEPRDWITELNQIAAYEVDRAVVMRERKLWPCELVGAKSRRGAIEIGREVRDEIIKQELCPERRHFGDVLSGDDYQLEYYDDGYPKLPACLDRRRS